MIFERFNLISQLSIWYSESIVMGSFWWRISLTVKEIFYGEKPLNFSRRIVVKKKKRIFFVNFIIILTLVFSLRQECSFQNSALEGNDFSRGKNNQACCISSQRNAKQNKIRILNNIFSMTFQRELRKKGYYGQKAISLDIIICYVLIYYFSAFQLFLQLKFCFRKEGQHF